ncbi:MAG: hypothetical protein Tsb0034_14640 [Ekhidna sp.]
MLESYPETGTTNFKGQEIRLSFSEYINAAQLNQKLIITPKTDIKFKAVARRNQLIIKFEEPFEDSTTYNLNFADGVTDITENNPAVNLSLAFSTGSYIDSMRVSGQVIDLFEQTPASGYMVALYPYSDTLDYFKDQPIYFATTNDSGKYRLEYIKIDKYKLLAFEDKNKNTLLDPDSEAHGFIPGALELDSVVSFTTPIPTLLQNVKPIQFINTRSTGPYIEIKYNKTVSQYTIDSQYDFPSNLTGETKDVIRLYKVPEVAYGDSLQIIVNAQDSLNNQSIDTLRVPFIESVRKPSTFSYSLAPVTQHLTQDQKFRLQFNKPVTVLDSFNLTLEIDSSFLYEIKPSISFAKYNTEALLSVDLPLETIYDSIKKTIYPDSVTERPLPKSLDIILQQGSFLSAEGDTSERKKVTLSTTEPTSFGTLKFQLNTSYKRFTLQLLNPKKEVLYSHKDETTFIFQKVKPDTYTIRILIDENEDGVWSPGNLLQDLPPEPVYLHPEQTSLRENWVVDIELSF